MIDWKELLGLNGSPVPHPFLRTAAPDKPKPAPRTPVPDNVVYHAGRAFTQEQPAPDTFEDTLYNGGGTRSPEIGQADLDAVYTYRLDEGRYRTLKPYWVANMSAAETAKLFKGQFGYSPRTLDNYWKAYNEVQAALNPSPAR